MKKVVAFMILAVLLLTLQVLATPVQEMSESIAEHEETAQLFETYSGTCGENLTWSLDISTGVFTISGTGEMYNWSYATRPPWRGYITYITSIEMGNNVTTIGDMSFDYCKNLKNVTFSENITRIGNDAFFNCPNLQGVTFPDSLKSIGSWAFFGCDDFKSITIPDGVTSIESWAFSYCRKLESITIPDSVSTISRCAFAGCTSLKSITIPDSVKTIGDEAFKSCTGLESITIPYSVDTIIGSPFFECSNLKEVIIYNESVIFEREYVFDGCHEDLTLYGYTGSTTQTYAKENNISFSALDPTTLNVAQIRTNNPQGMRYAAYIEIAAQGCEYGYIVTRESLLKEVSGETINYDLFKFNTENPGYNGTAISGVTAEGLKYVGAVAISSDGEQTIYSTTGQEFGQTSLGDGLYFTTVLKDIPDDKYEEKFVGRPYVKTPNGMYLYGETITRSIYEVAKAVPENERNEYIWSIIYAVEGEPDKDTYIDVSELLK